VSLSLIYARSRNHCIGDAGRVPWNLADEYASFNRITDGHALIMGRRSFEDHNCVLPGRLNIVVSHNPDLVVANGVVITSSLAMATNLAYRYSPEIFIIGGVSLLTVGFESAETVYESVIDTHITGDTFLPRFDFSKWHTQILERHPIDDRHLFSFTIHRHSRSG